MSNFSLQTLTWGTVAAAIASALWLASGDSGFSAARAERQVDRSSASNAATGVAPRAYRRPPEAGDRKRH